MPRDEFALASLFSTATATAWQERLVPQGVACVRADCPTYGEFLRDDPQAAEAGLVAEATGPAWGAHRRQAVMATLSETPGVVRSAERLGASTRSVLGELGYSTAEIEDFVVRRIVGV